MSKLNIEMMIRSHKVGSDALSDELKISSGPSGFETYYAPFDHINHTAKVVICGITPGKSQALIALDEARRVLDGGGTFDQALKSAKETASFAGAMRNNHCSMLDHVGLPKLLGLSNTAEIFANRKSIVHYTSVLRYPVFKNGSNYSGSSQMTSSPYLWEQSLKMLTEEATALPGAIWILMGPKVSASLEKLASQGVIDRSRILSGLPHPSGANAERIAYFEGRKSRDSLSKKVNPDIIDAAKHALLQRVSAIG